MNTGGITVVAEIANAHQGSPDTARQLVGAAAEAGADGVKFQIIIPEELAVPTYPTMDTYRRLCFSREEWSGLFGFAREKGVGTWADVFGGESLAIALECGADGLKIHIADICNRGLLKSVGAAGKPVLLSCGGAEVDEITAAVALLQGAGSAEVILMHGFQGYPTDIADTDLRRIGSLRSRFGLRVGFAGHLNGGDPDAVWLPVLAAAAGAELLETHITLERAAKGLDYQSSLEPDRFAMMVAVLRRLEPALGRGDFALSPRELEYRGVHGKVVVAAADLKSGTILQGADLVLLRVPEPDDDCLREVEAAVGKRLRRNLSRFEPLPGDDIST